MAVKISRAQVNAWRLSHHHLLQRARKTKIEKVVSDLCGVRPKFYRAPPLQSGQGLKELLFKMSKMRFGSIVLSSRHGA